MCVPTCIPGRSRPHTLYASDEEGSGRQEAGTAGRLSKTRTRGRESPRGPGEACSVPWNSWAGP